MGINKIGCDATRPGAAHDLDRPSATPKPAGDGEARAVERIDRIEISAEGREMAAQLLREGDALTESRAEVIRSRVESGYYNEASVAGRVAERLVASGDLDVLA